jgi:hypothetical protein
VTQRRLTCPHYCADWDYMYIKPGDPEFECCAERCECPEGECLYAKEPEEELTN